MTSPRTPVGARTRAALAAAVLLVLGACGTGTDTTTGTGTAAVADVQVYDVTSSTVAGEPWDAAGLAGRPAVLWFWAPWCPTCRAQVSGVNALATAHGDDVAVVGVGAQDDAEAIAGFASLLEPGVVVLSDVDGAVWRHYGVTAQSTYLVLDESGATVAEGYLDEAELADVVADLAD